MWGMRVLAKKDIVQRGCRWCRDREIYKTTAERPEWVEKGKHMVICPFDECPYHEMDEYMSYAEYIEATNEEFARLIMGISSKKGDV